MAAEDELLKLLDPAIRQRIEKDHDRYAPLIALLGAWQEEVQGHTVQMERNVVGRLMQELFPQGAWRFPGLTLAVPTDLVRREVGEEAAFIDRSTQTPWTPCGSGWTLPTRLENWSVEQRGFEQYALVCEIYLESRQPNARLLTPPQPPDDPLGHTQLAFVCGSEEIVAELAGADWAVQHPDEPFLPIGVSRYLGYLDFEQGVGAARVKQRQLESWLPPFYPYTRKFLRFFVPPTTAEFDPRVWQWLGSGGRKIRLAAHISEQTALYLERQKDLPPLILNAIPVAQMRTASEPLFENPDRVGDSFKKPFMGVWSCFAASARETRATAEGAKVAYHPARMLSRPSDDPRDRVGVQNVDVLCDRPAGALSEFRVRAHYECFGEQAAVPKTLSRPNGLRFSVPLPTLGGMDASIVGYEDAGSRRSWYHTLLRAPQLTQGDILEILQGIPACRNSFDLDPDSLSIQLDVETKPWIERAPWDNYLWPCLVSETSLLEQRATYLTRSRVAIIPVMRLIFQQGRVRLPAFLQEDLARYAASVISQYFMIGWYRVVGKMGKT